MNDKLLNVVAEMINDSKKKGGIIPMSLDADMSKRVADLQKKEENVNYHDILLDAHPYSGYFNTLFHKNAFEKYKTKRKSLSLSEKIEADKFQHVDFLPFEIGLNKRMDRGASIHPSGSKELWLYDLYNRITTTLPITLTVVGAIIHYNLI